MLVLLIAISLAGCIQWEEDGENSPVKAIDEYDKFKDVKIYGSHQVANDLTLVVLEGTYTQKGIWVAEVHFIEKDNRWKVNNITHLMEPNENWSPFEIMLESDEGYRVGFLKSDSKNKEIEKVDKVINIESYDNWKVWIQKN